MKIILITSLLIFSLSSDVLNYIGKHENEIKEMMKTHQPNFSLDESTINRVYKYLKYVGRSGEQTWLFFLDEDDYCTSSKLMSDYSNLMDKIEELDATYKKIDESKWKYMSDGQEYIVTLVEGDWFFTIYTKKKKD